MRTASAAILFATAIGALVLQAQSATAQQSVRDGAGIRTTVRQDVTPIRRRPRVRIYGEDYVPNVYPRYNPGPNAVRDCTATYVREFRPSGTVITPRMSCFWRQP